MTFAFDYGALEDEGSLPGEVVVVGGGGEYYEYYGGRLTELLDKGHSITLGSWEDDLAAGGGEGVVDEMLTLTLAGGDEGGAGGTLSSELSESNASFSSASEASALTAASSTIL